MAPELVLPKSLWHYVSEVLNTGSYYIVKVSIFHFYSFTIWPHESNNEGVCHSPQGGKHPEAGRNKEKTS